MARIVLDTNVLVAAAYSETSASRQIVEGCLVGELELVLSLEMRREYDHIIHRAVRRKNYHEKLFKLMDQAIMVKVLLRQRFVPDDPDDDKVVGLALAADAIAIITNDEHLLQLKLSDVPRIVRPHDFVTQIWKTG